MQQVLLTLRLQLVLQQDYFQEPAMTPMCAIHVALWALLYGLVQLHLTHFVTHIRHLIQRISIAQSGSKEETLTLVS